MGALLVLEDVFLVALGVFLMIVLLSLLVFITNFCTQRLRRNQPLLAGIDVEDGHVTQNLLPGSVLTPMRSFTQSRHMNVALYDKFLLFLSPFLRTKLADQEVEIRDLKSSLQQLVTQHSSSVTALEERIETLNAQIAESEVIISDFTRRVAESRQESQPEQSQPPQPSQLTAQPLPEPQSSKATHKPRDPSIFKQMLSDSPSSDVSLLRPKASPPKLNLVIPRHVVTYGHPMTSHQDHVLHELLKTEAFYLETLELLKSQYHDALLESNVDPKTVEAVFPNIQALIQIHATLLQQFKTVLEAPDLSNAPSSVARILEQSAPQFTFYKVYVQAIEGQRSTRLQFASRSDLRVVFELGSRDPRAAGRDFESLVIMPLQRVLKYSLLFGELAKACPESDYAAIQRAIQSIQGVTLSINQSQHNAQARAALTTWAHNLKEHQGLLHETRFVVREFDCAVANKGCKLSDSKASHPNGVTLVVCNDMLFVASKKTLLVSLFPYSQTVLATRTSHPPSSTFGYILRNETNEYNSVYVQAPANLQLFVTTLRDAGVFVKDPEFPNAVDAVDQ
eukprot:c7750_g1_i1.p1 GENE.c7750_g1_i1~~c7750_g1_i1.p1  ORF type:complete len:581 (-),score=134.42 c7750_g1_i1:9-1703(-)